MKYWHNKLTGKILKSDIHPNGQFWEEISRDEYSVIVDAVSNAPTFYSESDGKTCLIF